MFVRLESAARSGWCYLADGYPFVELASNQIRLQNGLGSYATLYAEPECPDPSACLWRDDERPQPGPQDTPVDPDSTPNPLWPMRGDAEPRPPVDGGHSRTGDTRETAQQHRGR